MAKDWMVKESDLEKDDYEYRVLHAILDKSCIVSGCAGSGKSVLALIKAQRIQREKRSNDYQIIVFTKALCKYMNAGRNELGLTKPFDYHWNFKNSGCPSSDYIIVDEIQDFDKEEIKEFINATRKHFFFFGDTAQSIYNGILKSDGSIKTTMPVNRISSIVPDNKDFETFNLCHNYRLPLPVAKVAQYVGVSLPPFNENIYKSPEKSIPRFVSYPSFDKQIEAIARIIKNGNVSDVGILVPHNEDVKRIHDMLKQLHVNHELKYDDKKDWNNNLFNLDFTTGNPKVMTYHSAKGLQFGTVFLPGVEKLTVDSLESYWSGGQLSLPQLLSTDEKRKVSDQKAFYVAMTRTYRDLFVLYSGNMPFPLSKVPRNLYKTTEKDVVEDI